MSSISQPAVGGPTDEFHRDYRSWRTFFSIALSVLAGTLTVIACIPLFSVLIMLIMRGGARLIQGGLSVFTHLPPGPRDSGGGFGNAIVGTAFMVGIAMLIAVPFGILAAIFLAEYAGKSRFAVSVRFSAKILTGLPSILAGVFAYATLVTLTGYSALAGGIALSVLIIPIVLLTAEEAIKMVPQKMREAAVGMGCTQA
jgi:phosphate transport system permease protein